jgi:hypothetical protein
MTAPAASVTLGDDRIAGDQLTLSAGGAACTRTRMPAPARR